MKLRELSNENLVAELKRLKAREDSVLIEVLDHIVEFERRQLFIRLGFPNLYAYMTKELRYSDGEAYRRIEAARLMRAVPESRGEIAAGRLNLTLMTDVRSAIKAKERILGRAVPVTDRRDLLRAIVGCTRAEAQKILSEKIPELMPIFEERRREHRDGSLELTLLFDVHQRRRLERSRELLASKGPMPKTVDTIDRLSEFFLSKKDMTRSPLAGEGTMRQMSLTTRLPVAVRREVFRRDKGECQFKNADGGICGSRYQVEIDHIVPLSKGGTGELSNLRCLCRSHNQWKADRLD